MTTVAIPLGTVPVRGVPLAAPLRGLLLLLVGVSGAGAAEAVVGIFDGIGIALGFFRGSFSFCFSFGVPGVPLRLDVPLGPAFGGEEGEWGKGKGKGRPVGMAVTRFHSFLFEIDDAGEGDSGVGSMGIAIRALVGGMSVGMGTGVAVLPAPAPATPALTPDPVAGAGAGDDGFEPGGKSIGTALFPFDCRFSCEPGGKSGGAFATGIGSCGNPTAAVPVAVAGPLGVDVFLGGFVPGVKSMDGAPGGGGKADRRGEGEGFGGSFVIVAGPGGMAVVGLLPDRKSGRCVAGEVAGGVAATWAQVGGMPVVSFRGGVLGAEGWWWMSASR